MLPRDTRLAGCGLALDSPTLDTQPHLHLRKVRARGGGGEAVVRERGQGTSALTNVEKALYFSSRLFSAHICQREKKNRLGGKVVANSQLREREKKVSGRRVLGPKKRSIGLEVTS